MRDCAGTLISDVASLIRARGTGGSSDDMAIALRMMLTLENVQCEVS